MKTDDKLIAEFMGFNKNVFEPEFYVLPSPYNSDGPFCSCEFLRFSNSWDWLMPVVKKISQMHDSKFKYDFTQIKQGHWPADNEYMEVITLPLATPILDVHKSVVQFIKWYNQNPTQP